MRLTLTVEVLGSVDDHDLAALLAAASNSEGITLNLPGSFKHRHTVPCTSSHIDVDLVDVERADLVKEA